MSEAIPLWARANSTDDKDWHIDEKTIKFENTYISCKIELI